MYPTFSSFVTLLYLLLYGPNDAEMLGFGYAIFSICFFVCLFVMDLLLHFVPQGQLPREDLRRVSQPHRPRWVGRGPG